ncbi:MAG: gliding motility-associated C-terminal domain-containing protein, partial [Bacteroidia bacterium]|nr:gliding motility-associated C-terminal domain-containing protein [Bacteroidia bacterium]
SMIVSINSGYPIANGTAYIDANGMVVYTPNAGFFGNDTVEYIVTDNGVPVQSAIAQVFITVNALPDLSATHTDVNCFGGADGTIDLTVTGIGPFLYNWSNGETIEDIDSLAPGTYTVTVTDSITGCNDTLSVTISEPTNPLSAVITTVPVSCFGDSTGAASVAVTGGTAPYLYQWSTSATDTTDSISGLYTGTYTVTITDANNCIFVISDSVAQPLAALADTAVLTNILCFGDSTGAIDLTISGGTVPYMYVWSTGDTTEDISGLPAGSYTVTVTDINGCGLIATYNLGEPYAPLSMTYTTTPANCLLNIGGNIDVTVVGGTGPGTYTYLWSPIGLVIEDPIGVAADTFTVTITDANGCILIETVILEDTSTIYTTASGSLEFCDGDSVELSTTVYPGSVYQWNVKGNPISNATNPTFTATVQGDYTVTMTNPCGTFTTGSATVTVNALPLVTISEDDEVCNGESITLDATGGSSYEWTPSLWLDDPYLPNPIATPLQNIVYTVTVTSADGCITIDSVEVTICDSIFIPTGFSPNGDGKNDAFEIPGALYYPNNVLKIFNRWGNLVFEADGYKNDWTGVSNVNNVLFGNELPEATYYYIFDPNVPGIEAQMGFVVIKR